MNNIPNLKKISPILAAFFVGVFVTATATFVFAHGGNTNYVHSCVKNSNGSIRIVGANETCNDNETALDWSQNGIGTFGGLTTNQLIGYSSNSESFDYRMYDAANFTNANLDVPHMAFASFVNSNFTNAIWNNAVVNSSNFTNANFTSANLNTVSFANTNLTGANFTGSNRTDVNWTNTVCPDGTNSDNDGNTCEGHLIP